MAYCWWKKSCTTWHVWNPVNYGIFTISTGAGFLPSTVLLITGSFGWAALPSWMIHQFQSSHKNIRIIWSMMFNGFCREHVDMICKWTWRPVTQHLLYCDRFSHVSHIFPICSMSFYRFLGLEPFEARMAEGSWEVGGFGAPGSRGTSAFGWGLKQISKTVSRFQSEVCVQSVCRV